MKNVTFSDTDQVKKVSRRVVYGVVIFLIVIFVLAGNPVTVVPAGSVGVKDFFGSVGEQSLSSGVHVVMPFTKVVKMSIKTHEIKEAADVPSKEGLILKLEVSLLFRLDPQSAPSVYKNIGLGYVSVVVEPQFRSAIREITASHDAKALYSSAREEIAGAILARFHKLTGVNGIITEQVLLRKVDLPAVVANAIQQKLKSEQEAEQMKFVLQKATQEAKRKKIEASGIAEFQRIVAKGISEQLLEWKGIEATEKLADSPNAKVVVIGNSKNGLPIILGNSK